LFRSRGFAVRRFDGSTTKVRLTAFVNYDLRSKLRNPILTETRAETRNGPENQWQVGSLFFIARHRAYIGRF
jgi:hypothetical protein